jgi:hypothetical protein
MKKNEKYPESFRDKIEKILPELQPNSEPILSKINLIFTALIYVFICFRVPRTQADVK